MNIEEQLMEMVSEKAPLRYQRDEQTLREAARILRACRAAGFIDENGNVLLPSSALFRTRDQAIVKPGDCVFVVGKPCKFMVHEDGTVACAIRNDKGEWRDLRVDECYSTREAAQAAAAKEADHDKA